eukprot:tig00000737_g3816.t1
MSAGGLVQAKFAASVRWLVGLLGASRPHSELRESRTQLSWIRHRVADLLKGVHPNEPIDVHDPGVQRLISGGVGYLAGCAVIFKDRAASIISERELSEGEAAHACTLEILARCGQRPPSSLARSGPPTRELASRSGLAGGTQALHASVMDCLMDAWTRLHVSKDAVVSLVRSMPGVRMSVERPYDAEDALLLWANAVARALVARSRPDPEAAPPATPGDGGPDSPVSKRASAAGAGAGGTIEDLLLGFSDGRIPAALAAYYCPEAAAPPPRASLGSPSSVEQRAAQLRAALAALAAAGVPCPLRVEDLLAADPALRPNAVAYAAALLLHFETRLAGASSASSSARPERSELLRRERDEIAALEAQLRQVASRRPGGRSSEVAPGVHSRGSLGRSEVLNWLQASGPVEDEPPASPFGASASAPDMEDSVLRGSVLARTLRAAAATSSAAAAAAAAPLETIRSERGEEWPEEGEGEGEGAGAMARASVATSVLVRHASGLVEDAMLAAADFGAPAAVAASAASLRPATARPATARSDLEAGPRRRRRPSPLCARGRRRGGAAGDSGGRRLVHGHGRPRRRHAPAGPRPHARIDGQLRVREHGGGLAGALGSGRGPLASARRTPLNASASSSPYASTAAAAAAASPEAGAWRRGGRLAGSVDLEATVEGPLPIQDAVRTPPRPRPLTAPSEPPRTAASSAVPPYTPPTPTSAPAPAPAAGAQRAGCLRRGTSLSRPSWPARRRGAPPRGPSPTSSRAAPPPPPRAPGAAPRPRPAPAPALDEPAEEVEEEEEVAAVAGPESGPGSPARPRTAEVSGSFDLARERRRLREALAAHEPEAPLASSAFDATLPRPASAAASAAPAPRASTSLGATARLPLPPEALDAAEAAPAAGTPLSPPTSSSSLRRGPSDLAALPSPSPPVPPPAPAAAAPAARGAAATLPLPGRRPTTAPAPPASRPEAPRPLHSLLESPPASPPKAGRAHAERSEAPPASLEEQIARLQREKQMLRLELEEQRRRMEEERRAVRLQLEEEKKRIGQEVLREVAQAERQRAAALRPSPPPPSPPPAAARAPRTPAKGGSPGSPLKEAPRSSTARPPASAPQLDAALASSLPRGSTQGPPRPARRPPRRPPPPPSAPLCARIGPPPGLRVGLGLGAGHHAPEEDVVEEYLEEDGEEDGAEGAAYGAGAGGEAAPRSSTAWPSEPRHSAASSSGRGWGAALLAPGAPPPEPAHANWASAASSTDTEPGPPALFAAAGSGEAWGEPRQQPEEEEEAPLGEATRVLRAMRLRREAEAQLRREAEERAAAAAAGEEDPLREAQRRKQNKAPGPAGAGRGRGSGRSGAGDEGPVLYRRDEEGNELVVVDADVEEEERERRRVKFLERRQRQAEEARARREADAARRADALRAKEEEARRREERRPEAGPPAAGPSGAGRAPSPAAGRPAGGRPAPAGTPPPMAPRAEKSPNPRPRPKGPSIEPPLIAGKSNRKLVRNALGFVCLAGAAMQRERDDVLWELENNASDHFVILFRNEKGLNFRGLYAYNAEARAVQKVYGSGPPSVDASMVDRFFKYDSGSKRFDPVPTKQFSVTTDAMMLFPQHYKAGPRARPST